MILYAIHKIPSLRKYYFRKAGRKFSEKKINAFIRHIAKEETILDIGSGGGLIAYLLKQKGWNVTPLDIAKGNYHPDVEPVVYDGITIPFGDKSVDCGLLL
ncbi:MAG: class I SAM-dependent methyltransferase, partial [Chitinophagales bacterium]